MTKLIIVLGLLVLIGGGIALFHRSSKKTGQNEQKLEDAEDAIDKVKKSNSVKHDATFDDELRKKYNK